MDKISLAGLAIGLVAIIGGQILEGGHVGSLIQPTAFLIVIGGTLGAVMLQSPLPVFTQGMRMVRWVFVPPAVWSTVRSTSERFCFWTFPPFFPRACATVQVGRYRWSSRPTKSTWAIATRAP